MSDSIQTAFACNGSSYTLAEMLATNADDAEICAWLRTARNGDRFDTGLGEGVVCLAPRDFVVAVWTHDCVEPTYTVERHLDSVAATVSALDRFHGIARKVKVRPVVESTTDEGRRAHPFPMSESASLEALCGWFQVARAQSRGSAS